MTLTLGVQIRSQIVSLRRAGMSVTEIADRLGITKSTEIHAIRQICDSLPRKYGLGGLTTPEPAYRRR